MKLNEVKTRLKAELQDIGLPELALAIEHLVQDNAITTVNTGGGCEGFLIEFTHLETKYSLLGTASDGHGIAQDFDYTFGLYRGEFSNEDNLVAMVTKALPTALLEVLDFHGETKEWISACVTGRFYTVAVPLFGGGYSIGSAGEGDSALPELYPSLEDARNENQAMKDSYITDIENGDRDEADEWEGEVLELHWTGESTMITLVSEGHTIYEGDWRQMAGIL